MSKVHLMNLIQTCNIIMTSFNKIKAFNSGLRECDDNNKKCEKC